MAFSELIALYLFLGGTAAGAFAVMAALDLHASVALSRHVHPLSAHRGDIPSQAFAHHVSKLVYAVSFFMLLTGLLCLLADLGKPQAFYFLFLYPTASFMSVGSFALALLSICMAVVFAFAWLFPDARMMLIFLPIPISARVFVALYAIVELFFGVAGFSFDNIAHFAHLGGMLFGWLLILYWKRKGTLYG